MSTKKIFPLLSILFLFILGGCKDSNAQTVKVLSPNEVKDAMYNEKTLQLVDVRTLEEYNEGHLKQAQNICVTCDDFDEKINKLDKNKPVYVYCRSGKRSAAAAKRMQELGFREIYDMEGGYLKWVEREFESEK